MPTPNKLRTQAVDTSKTTPEAFLAGASAPVLSGPPAASPPPDLEVLQVDPPSAPIPQVASPQPTPTSTPDLFVLVSRAGTTAHVARTLRAMEVPGGLVIKVAYAIAPDVNPRSEALCFIPGLKIADLTEALTQAVI